MQRVGAQGHATFGGRLARDARGFPASAMAKESAGDWRDAERIRAWAQGIAGALPTAVPLPWHESEARSLPRLFLRALVGWVLCAATIGALLAVTSVATALVLHLVAAPLLFMAVAIHYHRVPGARAPLPTALTFTGVTGLLDLLVVAVAVQHSLRCSAVSSAPGCRWR